jgi:hypothetical protein
MNYDKVLGKAVHRKWPKPAQKEWWWTKFSAARRKRTAKLSESQNHRCAFCGGDTYLGAADFKPGMSEKRHLATLEHIKTQSEGGSDSPSNCVMSCNECNRLRGTMDAWKFYELRIDPLAWLAWVKRRRHMKSLVPKVRKKSEEERESRRQRISYELAVACLLDPDFKDRFLETLDWVERITEKGIEGRNKENKRRNARRDLLRRAEREASSND